MWWVNTQCPKCQGPKLSLGFSEQFWNATCWRCGRQNAWDAIAELAPRVSRSDIAKAYAGRGRPDMGKTQPDRKLARLKEPATTPLLPSHREYLKRRGYDVDMLTSMFGIKSTERNAMCETTNIGGRIYAPIRDMHDGMVSSWTTRAAGGDHMRWFTAPRKWERIQSGSLLYGIEHIQHTVIIVEGPSDVWGIGPGAAATMGMVVSDAQITQLASIPRRVVLFDSSSQEKRRANQLAAELGHYPGETIVAQLEHADDPGDPQAKPEIDFLRDTYLPTWN